MKKTTMPAPIGMSNNSMTAPFDAFVASMNDADSVVWDDEDTFAVGNVGQLIEGQRERTD